jgi:hypothetical protein
MAITKPVTENSSNYLLVRQAIQDRRSIVAVYQGHMRFMSPHVIGRKNSREQALFYQFGGTSSSKLEPLGSPSNWRCIPIGLMTDLKVMDSTEWATGPNHSRPQTCVGEIDLEVTY